MCGRLLVRWNCIFYHTPYQVAIKDRAGFPAEIKKVTRKYIVPAGCVISLAKPRTWRREACANYFDGGVWVSENPSEISNTFHQSRQFRFGDIVVPDLLNHRALPPTFHDPLRFVIGIDPYWTQKGGLVESRRRFLEIDTCRKNPLDGLAHDHGAMAAKHHCIAFSECPGDCVALLDGVDQRGIHIDGHRTWTKEGAWIG